MIVLDSSFLIGFHNERDAHHARARNLMERFLNSEWGPGLLLEYVFLEVESVLLLRRDLKTASHVGRLLLEAEELEFVRCFDLFHGAFETFTSQKKTKLKSHPRLQAEGL